MNFYLGISRRHFIQSAILFVCCLLLSCASPGKARLPQNPLDHILSNPELQPFLQNKDQYEIQIIYTQIDRDKQQKPFFTRWCWNVDSGKYFYPASTVKFPMALLALEKMYRLQSTAQPKIQLETPYWLTATRPHQESYRVDSSAIDHLPTIGRDIRAVFAVSENEAYNHLFEWVGRAAANHLLQEKGYVKTGILHRFYSGQRDQQYAQPISFYQDSGLLWQEGEKVDPMPTKNPQIGLKKGIGYIDSDSQLRQEAFDFSTKNWFALTDAERMLRAAIFPYSAPPQSRFDFPHEWYRQLHQWMGQFPDEFTSPVYPENNYPDNYVKFLVVGDQNKQMDGSIRIFNKVGEAYGTLTDIAYVVDFDNQTEFILAATILCNSDEVFNDDQYDYETVGLPFMGKLGRAVLAYEKSRKRKVKPDLSYWSDLFVKQ